MFQKTQSFCRCVQAEVDNGSQAVYIDFVTDQMGSLFLLAKFNHFPVMTMLNSGFSASAIHPDVLCRFSRIPNVHRDHQSEQLCLGDVDVVSTQRSVELWPQTAFLFGMTFVAAVVASAVVRLDFM